MLVKCRECMGEVSDLASVCPHCGCPVSVAEAVQKAEKRPGRSPLLRCGCVLVLGFIALLVFEIATATLQRQEESDRLLAEAHERYTAGDYKGAAVRFRKAERLHGLGPEDLRAYANSYLSLGKGAAAERRYSSAIHHFDKAGELDTALRREADAEALAVHMEQGAEGLARTRKSRDAGELLRADGSAEIAFHAYQSALRLDPENQAALTERDAARTLLLEVRESVSRELIGLGDRAIVGGLTNEAGVLLRSALEKLDWLAEQGRDVEDLRTDARNKLTALFRRRMSTALAAAESSQHRGNWDEVRSECETVEAVAAELTELGLEPDKVADIRANARELKAVAEGEILRAKDAAERALEEAARQAAQNLADAYIKLIEAAQGEQRLVDRVSVRRVGDSWMATLTVSNRWHTRHRQIRLQDAQTLWEAWASVAAPEDPDAARIKLVDQRGNGVGGSRIWGGSLIWVAD